MKKDLKLLVIDEMIKRPQDNPYTGLSEIITILFLRKRLRYPTKLAMKIKWFFCKLKAKNIINELIKDNILYFDGLGYKLK